MRGITPRRYRLDPTGLSVNNKVVNEPRYIGTGKNVRCVVPRCGAFYTKSLKVFDAHTHQLLIPNQDYKCLHLDAENTSKFGQPIAYMIAITNPSVSSDIYFSLQALGGLSSYLVELLNQLVPMIDTDDRVVSWTNITNRPDDFNPGKHYHDVGDFYGLEYLVLSLIRISSMIVDKDLDNHTGIRAYLNIVQHEFETKWDAFINDLNTHVNDKNNPHVDTASLINAYRQVEVNNLLTNKLKKTDKAVNSNKVYNLTPTQLAAEIRKDYNAATLGSGTFGANQLGNNYATASASTPGNPASSSTSQVREPASGEWNVSGYYWQRNNGIDSIYWGGVRVYYANSGNASTIVVGNTTYYRGNMYSNTTDQYNNTTQIYGVYRIVTVTTTIPATPGYTPIVGLSNSGWQDIKSLLGSIDPIYVGSSTEANVKSTFSSYPVGTIVNWIVVDNGHENPFGFERLFISYHMVKTGTGANDWAYI